MSKIIAAVRKEVVVIAGLLTGVLSFVVANDNVIAGIIPLVVSLLTRSQVSPLQKLEELLQLIGELKTRAAKAEQPSAPTAGEPKAK